MLRNVKVQERISELRSQQSKRTEVTADRVISELAAIAFADRTELAKVDKNGSVKFTPTDRLPDDTQREVLTRRYLLYQKWEYIAVEMDYTIRRIHQLHGDALKKIALYFTIDV